MHVSLPKIEDFKRLSISFSGGRSSAVMLKRCLDKYSATHEISVVFANTGCEHEATLKFVDDVDKNFAGGRVVWIEAVINGKGVGVSHRIVDFKTASRKGEPMRDAVAKHGVFCTTHPQCTSRLKTEAMQSYRESIGWFDGDYVTAIGIRADEADRMSSKAIENKLVYPLVSEGWRKRDVNEFMKRYDFDLKLPSAAEGNCVWCWKKSLRKLMTVAKTNPDAFDLPGELERRYGTINNGDQEQPDPRVFFRNRMSAQDIIKKAYTTKFQPYEDDKFEQQELFNDLLDVGQGCGDSCEIGADE